MEIGERALHDDQPTIVREAISHNACVAAHRSAKKDANFVLTFIEDFLHLGPTPTSFFQQTRNNQLIDFQEIDNRPS